MSDQINLQQPENTNPTNGVLEVKLDYIQKDINTIKADIKEIKSDYIVRREFEKEIGEVKERLDGVENRLQSIESNVWKFIGGLAVIQVVILPIVLYLLFKRIG